MSDHNLQADPVFDVIAASFFRKKHCLLPGIGRLELLEEPAKYDFLNQQMHPPKPVLHFHPLQEDTRQFNEFSAISHLLKEKLLRNGEVAVTGLGVFTYNNGLVDFLPASLDAALLQPVKAVKVVHKDAVHAMIVGDRETNTAVMQEWLSESAPEQNGWWKAPLMAALLAAAAVGYYLYTFGINGLSSLSPF